MNFELSFGFAALCVALVPFLEILVVLVIPLRSEVCPMGKFLLFTVAFMLLFITKITTRNLISIFTDFLNFMGDERALVNAEKPQF